MHRKSRQCRQSRNHWVVNSRVVNRDRDFYKAHISEDGKCLRKLESSEIIYE